MNSIAVLFFANLRDIVGERKIIKEIAPGIKIVELKDILMKDFPGLKKFNQTLIVAMNHEFADNDAIIPDGAEIAIFPPVSGGIR